MWIYIFMIVWILSTHPITKMVNERMAEKGDEEMYSFTFQFLLFIKALIHSPKFWLGRFKRLINNK